MRISDWSSDVCSSDLTYNYTAFFSNVRGRSHTEHTDYLTTTANLLASVQLTPRDRLTFKLIDNELDADLSLRLSLDQYRENPYQQIGRASCRERVCQYV